MLELFAQVPCVALALYVVVMLVMTSRRERRKCTLPAYYNNEKEEINGAAKVNSLQGHCLFGFQPQNWRISLKRPPEPIVLGPAMREPDYRVAADQTCFVAKPCQNIPCSPNALAFSPQNSSGAHLSAGIVRKGSSGLAPGNCRCAA